MKTKTALLAIFAFALIGSAQADDWPGWRGGNRSDVSQETGLLKSWPEGGPPRVWLSKKCGVGYSGFAVVGANVYTMGAYANDERLICTGRATRVIYAGAGLP